MKIFKKLTSFLIVSTLVVPAIATAAPADTPAGSTIEQRVKQRVQEQKIKLTAKEILRYKSRCVATQTTVRDLQNKLGPIINNRQTVYKKIDAKLWIVIGQLKLAEKDTFNLEAQRAEYAKRVTAYNNTLNQYKQTIDDIVVMNCQADLNGFIALVKTAREYHASLRTQSDDISAYVVDTVKKTLSDFTTELQPKTSTESEQ